MAQRTDGDDLDQVGDCRLMPVEDEIRLNELMCSVDVRSYMDCLPWATFGMCGSVSSLPMDGREVPPRGRRQRESEIHEQVRNPRNASFLYQQEGCEKGFLQTKAKPKADSAGKN